MMNASYKSQIGSKCFSYCGCDKLPVVKNKILDQNILQKYDRINPFKPVNVFFMWSTNHPLTSAISWSVWKTIKEQIVV